MLTGAQFRASGGAPHERKIMPQEKKKKRTYNYSIGDDM
jgi:hypothetical protein